MKRPILLTTASISATIAAALATIALVLVASGSNPALAASTLNNGNFETGDLSGWTVDTTKSGGEARAVTSYCPSLHESIYGTCNEQSGFLDEVFPKEGSYFALLQPSGGMTGGVFEDAIISQSFKASKGDKISGWAFFLPEDWSLGVECLDGFPICGWNNVTGKVVIKSDSGTTVATPFQQSYNRQTGGGDSGWMYWEHTFTDLTGEGSFQLEARTSDSYVVDSSIGLDDVKTSTNGLDTTDPDTTITSQPANPTTSTTASFSFTSTEAGSTFECSKDNQTWATCTSPYNYSTTALQNGSYSFYVRAKDAAGNVDQTPVSYTWTVNTTPSCTKSGTSANDTISGTSGRDVICGLGGSDTIKGLGGDENDKLIGGTGNDTLDGGLGTDTGSFAPSLTAVNASLATNAATGEGSDTFVGVENLQGSSKADTLAGSGTNNTLTGGGGDDTVRGGAGNDKVVGSGGADSLFGEGGNDTVNSKDGVNDNDSLDGGIGTDTKVTDATEKAITGFP